MSKSSDRTRLDWEEDCPICGESRLPKEMGRHIWSVHTEEVRAIGDDSERNRSFGIGILAGALAALSGFVFPVSFVLAVALGFLALAVAAFHRGKL